MMRAHPPIPIQGSYLKHSLGLFLRPANCAKIQSKLLKVKLLTNRPFRAATSLPHRAGPNCRAYKGLTEGDQWRIDAPIDTLVICGDSEQ